MLGIVSSKTRKDNEGVRYIYIGKWQNALKTDIGYFRFAMVNDDNLQKQDFNKLSGESGQMLIQTKSGLPFKPDDLITFRGQRYSVLNVDGQRKEDGELAMVYFKTNGNITTYLTLRRLG